MIDGETPSWNFDRSVGPKIDHAALLRTFVGDGCPVALHPGASVRASTEHEA